MLPGFAQRRARDRRCAASRCARCDGDHARRAARRSHCARRMAGRLRGHVRRRVPRRAAGMPDPDDAAEPEVLRAGRRERRADGALPDREQPRTARSVGDRPRQRARAARTARRRPLLLRPGPQRAARPVASSRCARSSTTTSSARLGDRVERLRFLAAQHRRRASAPTTRCPIAPRSLRRPTSSPTWSASFPSCREQWAATTRCTTAKRRQVADAIAQHYWPRHAGDALPEAPVAQAVALADKLETLAGLFGIGALPTGDKDPFGLRRAAIGVLRILIEKRLSLPLPSLLGAFVPGLQQRRRRPKPVPEDVADFLYDRLRGHLREQGYTANQVEAVLVQRPSRIDLVPDAARGRQGVRGAARSGRAVRGEQADRQHPEEKRRRSGGRQSTSSGLTDGAEHDL